MRLIGIDITYENGGDRLNQERFIEDTLKKFNMENCKPVSTSIEPGLKLEKNDKIERKDVPYKNLIGTLMYIAVATQPDIMYAISYLSHFNDYSGEEHFKSAKRVLSSVLNCSVEEKLLSSDRVDGRQTFIQTEICLPSFLRTQS
ncbi:hypothetical protein evm_011293 [Chilo suppressalis]|nr:hypothetical protein evm_011293 [Chilo suppressalis]